jgi:hypothetical protein
MHVIRLLTHHVGINKVTANLESQLVSIVGTAAPSAIVDALQATGRDAILRGSGKSNSECPSITLQKLMEHHWHVKFETVVTGN